MKPLFPDAKLVLSFSLPFPTMIPAIGDCHILKIDPGQQIFSDTFVIDFSKIADAKTEGNGFDAGGIAQAIGKDCEEALKSADNILDTCDCKIPGLKEVATFLLPGR